MLYYASGMLMSVVTAVVGVLWDGYPGWAVLVFSVVASPLVVMSTSPINVVASITTGAVAAGLFVAIVLFVDPWEVSDDVNQGEQA